MNGVLSRTPFILVLCFASVYIYYADGVPNGNTRNRLGSVSNVSTTTTPWPTLKSRRDYVRNGNSKQGTLNRQQQSLQGPTTSTPWPTLKSRRDYVNPSISVASRNKNNKAANAECKVEHSTTTANPWPTLKSRRDYVGPSMPKPMGAWSSNSNKQPLTTNTKANNENISHMNEKQQPSMPNIADSRRQQPPNPAAQTETKQNAAKSMSSSKEDDELREFSETLLKKDVNNAAKYVSVNLQSKTTSRSTTDEAPEPLLTLQPDVFKISTISKLIELYDNYFLDSTVNEYVTAKEKREEAGLLDAMLATSIMQHTRTFLIEKGKLSKDPKDFRDLLKQIWFGMYSRGGGRIGSSGFEHVFLAEIKNNAVSGLHNWVYFNAEELKKNANYLGYMKKIDLENKGAIIKYHFKYSEIDKPVGSMFVGTSPELEVALYTTCFVMRADQKILRDDLKKKRKELREQFPSNILGRMESVSKKLKEYVPLWEGL